MVSLLLDGVTMNGERVEKLKREYTGQRVVVESGRPELAQLADRQGRVKTINFNGRALVQFDGADVGWHDVELDYLKVIEDSEPEPAGRDPDQAAVEKPAGRGADSVKKPQATEKLSRLELARLEKEGQEKSAG